MPIMRPKTLATERVKGQGIRDETVSVMRYFKYNILQSEQHILRPL